MFQVKLFNKISSKGTELFDQEKYQCNEAFEDYDAVLVRSAKLHDTQFPENLKCIARAGAGVNNIPLDKCSEQGIVVFNTPGANANAVKELVIAAMLLSSRKIVQGINWTKTLAGNGDQIAPMAEKGKANFAGPEIEGKTLGIIGLGAIGVKVANAAIGLGMKVYGYDPYLSVNAALKMSRSVQHVTDLKEIFANSDYITVHVPLTDETKHTVSAETIKLMRDGVRVINLARGELVDEAAMNDALNSGKVACYVSDFATETMLANEHAIVLPHLGASTEESEENCARMAVLEIVEYLENGNVRNSVNFPSLRVPREADVRLCLIHKNIPNMIAAVSGVLSGQNINIENMGNRSKGNFAYTIVDTNSAVNAEAVKAIESVEGMISVRVLS